MAPHNIWSSNEHQPERTFPHHIPGEIRSKESDIEGITIDTMYDTDCHGDDGDAHIYFTIAYTNGTIAYDPRGRPGLFSFTTPWYISYPKTLRKAIFNDPTSYRSKQKSEDCKHGHCFSEVLPGWLYNDEPVKLKRVKNPKTLRPFTSDRDYFALGECHYDDSLLDIWRLSVYLGRIGYYIHGANIPPAVIDYVEDRVRTTYPTLEICLILWGTLGAIPTLIFVIVLLVWLVKITIWLEYDGPKRMWASAQRGREAMWKAIIMAPGKGWDAVKRRWKRGFRRQKSVVAPPNAVQSTADDQLPTYELPEWTPSELPRPPSYRTYDGGCEGFNVV
ncbi:hypothetical protein J4E90_008468 [Alternaria incomplexa]|uniref:uncharacterized protein n=1 Tax=Alternaria incomplexa TaxID=1187928 RepID=UPI0022202610|nr:uncharacterized protein J4E90_008468 [Alternaria incomplexa]KAI4908734.1 hypothetical protein J4E90_008468 [Alternaria incomplexa]